MITCKLCEKETTLDELESHRDIEPVSINDYVYCPHCHECKHFTTENDGDIEF